jgi:hypothetical protein
VTSEFLKPIVLIDIRTSEMTLPQIIDQMEIWRKEPRFRGYDIFMDGDIYAIVAAPARKPVGRMVR